MKCTKSIFIRFISVILSAFMLAACCSCGKDGESSEGKKKKPSEKGASSSTAQDSSSEDNSSSDTEQDFIPVIDLDKIDWGSLSGLESSETSSEEAIVFNPNDMFDGNASTYWSPYTTETVSLEFSLPEKISFNAIDFIEQRTYITDLTVEIKENGQYTQICKIDEMGTRTCILDTDFEAKDFRLTVTMSDRRGGIAEISFAKKAAFENRNNFRNVGYFTCSGIEILRNESYARIADKIAGYTDIIMFDFGSWDKEGAFLWGSTYEMLNEQEFDKILKEVRALEGTDNLNIWFCLQNYDRNTTVTTDELFATQAARDKLISFSVYMCETYDLYGIDIDYEYPTTELSWKNYDVFLGQLADALHAKGYKLSCAMSPHDIDISDSTISKIDYVNIMSYDIFDMAGRHASYANIRQHFLYFTELGFKPQQLVMGLPFYTRTMDSKHEFGKGYSGLAERWRGGLKPWVNVVTNKTWVYYFNGPNMIRDKVYYSMNEGMSGVFNWSMVSDVQNDNPYGIASLGQTIIDTVNRFSK